jgi:hypothetical protein
MCDCWSRRERQALGAQRRRADERIVGRDDYAVGDAERAAAVPCPMGQQDVGRHGEHQEEQEYLGTHPSPLRTSATNRTSRTPMASSRMLRIAPAARTRSV